MGIKIVFFIIIIIIIIIIFLSPCTCFFHMRSGHFSNVYGKLYLDLVDYIRYCLRSNF